MACSRNEEPKNESVSISTNIDLLIKDVSGQDLLNASTPNTLNTNNIKLFYLVNGQPQEVYNPNLSYPRNYFIFDYSLYNSNAIRVFPNDKSSDEFPITYIRWNESDTDTIKCHYLKGSSGAGSYIVCDKVWYNGILKYSSTENIGEPGRVIKIVK